MLEILVFYSIAGIALAELWLRARDDSDENSLPLKRGYLISISLWPAIVLILIWKICRGNKR